MSAIGVTASDAETHVTLPPVPCAKDMPDRELCDEDKPFKSRGDEGATLILGVISEGFSREDAGTADNVVDRAKFFDRGVRDLLRRRRQADVPFNKHEICRRCEVRAGKAT